MATVRSGCWQLPEDDNNNNNNDNDDAVRNTLMKAHHC